MVPVTPAWIRTSCQGRATRTAAPGTNVPSPQPSSTRSPYAGTTAVHPSSEEMSFARASAWCGSPWTTETVCGARGARPWIFTWVAPSASWRRGSSDRWPRLQVRDVAEHDRGELGGVARARHASTEPVLDEAGQVAGVIQVGMGQEHVVEGAWIRREGLPVAPAIGGGALVQARVHQEPARRGLHEEPAARHGADGAQERHRGARGGTRRCSTLHAPWSSPTYATSRCRSATGWWASCPRGTAWPHSPAPARRTSVPPPCVLDRGGLRHRAEGPYAS